MKATKWIAALAFLLACSGCSVISGTVTDADSGEPLADVQVGVMVLRPGNITARFAERGRTNSHGRYQIIYAISASSVTFRLDDYLSVAPGDTSNPLGLDVTMRSIVPIKGTWNATITVEGETIPATTFEFDENGMHWREVGDSFGIVDYDFDGSMIEIGDFLSHSDLLLGELTASLDLNESGDGMSGTIAFSGDFFEGTRCDSGCSGTVVAVLAAD